MTSNDPANPTTTLYMKGDVEVEFDFMSSGLRMGSIRKDETITKTVLLQMKDPQNTTITDISTSSPFVSAQLLGNDKNNEKRVKVEVTLKPGLPTGPISETVTVKSNLDSKPEATLRLSGEILGDISVTPNSLTYVVSDSSGIIGGDVKKLIVSNLNDSLPLELIKVEDPDGYLFIKQDTVVDKSKYDLNCLLRKDKIPEVSRHYGKIIITTNHPSEKEIPIDYKIIKRN